MEESRNLKKWVGAGAAGAAAFGLAWFWWIPSKIEQAALERAERIGLHASFGSVSLGWGKAHLDEAHIATGDGSLQADFDRIDVGFASLGDVFGGSPTKLVVRGGRVAVDALGEDVGAVLDDLRRPRRGDGGGGAKRELLVEGIDVGLRYGDNTAELRGLSVRRQEDGWQLRASAASAQDAGRHVLLTSPTLELVREDGGWRVRHLAAQGGILEARIAARPDEPVPAEEEAEPEEDLAAVGGSLPDEAGASQFRQDAGGDSKGRASLAQEATEASKSSEETILARARALFFERAATDFEGRLSGFQIRRTGAAAPAMTDISVDVEMLKRGQARVQGKGEARRGGSLSFDFIVASEELRAEGRLRAKSLPLSVLAPLLPAVPWYEPDEGFVDVELDLRTEPDASIHYDGRLEVRNAAFESARIAPIPIRAVDFRFEGEGRVQPLARRIEVSSARLSFGRAQIVLEGEMQSGGGDWALHASAKLPPTDCGDALAGIPADLLGDTAVFGLDGKIAGEIELQVDSTRLDDTRVGIRVADGCRFLMVPIVADLSRFSGPFVHDVLEPDGTHFEMVTGPGTDRWVRIEEISPFFIHAVLTHEDGGFFGHSGFSKSSIQDSFTRNLREGRFAVGASTITMQLAKNLFLHREKTLARKVQEVILTWWLERALGKKQILELYLNVIEYGPAIYGIREAADHYFGRDPLELSAAQGAFLACILPAPKRYHAYYERGALSESMTQRVKRFLGHMHKRGRIDGVAYEQALAEISRLRFGAEVAIPTLPPAAGSLRTMTGRAAPLPFDTGIRREEISDELDPVL